VSLQCTQHGRYCSAGRLCTSILYPLFLTQLVEYFLPPPFSAGRVDFPAFERWYFPVHSVHLQLLKPCKFNECRERERERLIESFIMRSHTVATQTAVQHISIYPGAREERGRSSPPLDVLQLWKPQRSGGGPFKPENGIWNIVFLR
jgi:hypothetical protein